MDRFDWVNNMEGQKLQFKSTEIIIDCIFFITVAIATIICNSDVLFSFLLCIWFCIFIHCIFDLYKYIPLLFFLVSMFVFLLGREVGFNYFGLNRYYSYLEPYNGITFILIILSLVFVFIGYENDIVLNKKKIVFDLFHKADFEITGKKVCKIVFIICYICSLYVVIFRIKQVKRLGYVGTYVSENLNTPGLVNYLSSFMYLSFCFVLSTKHKKRNICLLLGLFELYGILTLFSGHRFGFIATNMIILTYLCILKRENGKKINKRIFLYILFALPFVFMLMNYINSVRLNSTNSSNSLRDTIISFLDQQGGSVNVIKRIFYYEDDLKDMHFVSLSNIRAVLCENFIIRKLFHVTVYSGNSIEHALFGNSLSHRLSYYEYGLNYLKGHGVGSSYIAELFFDFGYIGVILGSLLYGKLLRQVQKVSFTHYFKDGFFLAIYWYLLIAPRDGFDNFISGVFNLFSLLLLWCIFILIKYRAFNKKKRHIS